jgi:hypothetical protein
MHVQRRQQLYKYNAQYQEWRVIFNKWIFLKQSYYYQRFFFLHERWRFQRTLKGRMFWERRHVWMSPVLYSSSLCQDQLLHSGKVSQTSRCKQWSDVSSSELESQVLSPIVSSYLVFDLKSSQYFQVSPAKSNSLEKKEELGIGTHIYNSSISRLRIASSS